MSLVLRYRAFSLDPVDPLLTTQLPLTPLPPSFKCWGLFHLDGAQLGAAMPACAHGTFVGL